MAKVFIGVTTAASQYMPVPSARLLENEVLTIDGGEQATASFEISNPEGKFWVIAPLDADLVWVNFQGPGGDEVGWPVFRGQPQYFEGYGEAVPSVFVPA